MRKLIWNSYADLKLYQARPGKFRRLALRARFDCIFRRRAGFVMLDRLPKRLHAAKAELLMRPEIPLHTNGSENDIRSVRLSAQRFAPEHAAAPDAIAALPSSASPRPVQSMASRSGIIRAAV